MRGQGVERVRVDDHGDLVRSSRPRKKLTASGSWPSPGPMAMTDFFSGRGSSNPASRLRPRFLRALLRAARGHQLRSHRGDGRQNRFGDGSGDEARPGAQSGEELMAGAPDLPLAPPMTRTCPKRPLLESAVRGFSVIVLEVPAQVRPVADSMASAGEPMGATTIGPAGEQLPET